MRSVLLSINILPIKYIITISSTYECIIVLIDLKQWLTYNNQKQKDKSSHLGLWGFFSDRRVVRLISRLIAVIDQSRSFWRSCQSRNLVRPSVDWSNQSRSLRKEFKTRGFALIQLTTWKRRHYFHFFFFGQKWLKHC